MARYTQLDFTTISQIASDYDLQVNEFSPIYGGAGNSSYHVVSRQGSYVLTVLDNKSHRHASQLGNILQRLEEHDFPASKVVKTLSREHITSYDGKPVMVKRFIEGGVYERLSFRQLLQTGNALARLHGIPAGDLLETDHPYGLSLFPSVFDLGVNPPYESWLQDKAAHIETGLPKGLPTGFVHGDLFYDNVLFENDQFRAIIDFEEACIYYRAFDLGMAIVGLCSVSGAIDLDQARALIEGYQQICPLNKEERNSLKLFTVYGAVATSFWRFWKFNIDSPDGSYSEHYLDMKLLADSIQDTTDEEFQASVFG